MTAPKLREGLTLVHASWRVRVRIKQTVRSVAWSKPLRSQLRMTRIVCVTEDLDRVCVRGVVYREALAPAMRGAERAVIIVITCHAMS